jgi:acyl-CoA synthetase (AMP-forming)/AMP-acid ligase II
MPLLTAGEKIDSPRDGPRWAGGEQPLVVQHSKPTALHPRCCSCWATSCDDAAVRGGKIAYAVGTDRLTYGESSTRARTSSPARWRGSACDAVIRIAVLATNRVEYPLVYFAAIKLGAIVVPVNARFTVDEVAEIVENAEAETFFVSPEFAALVTSLRAAGLLPLVRRFVAIGDASVEGAFRLDALADAEAADDVTADLDERDPHVMLYTSGTTGSPKGTLLSAPQLLARGDGVAPPARDPRRRRAAQHVSHVPLWEAGRCRSARGTPGRSRSFSRRPSRASSWRRSRASA